MMNPPKSTPMKPDLDSALNAHFAAIANRDIRGFAQRQFDVIRNVFAGRELALGGGRLLLSKESAHEGRIEAVRPQRRFGAPAQHGDRGPARVFGDEGHVAAEADARRLVAAQDRPFHQLAGNGVAFKPARRAGLAGELIARVLARAGLPEGLVRVVQGGADIGVSLAQSPVDKILFTGSPAVGRIVARECVSREKEVTVELGGKDAMLVL